MSLEDHHSEIASFTSSTPTSHYMRIISQNPPHSVVFAIYEKASLLKRTDILQACVPLLYDCHIKSLVPLLSSAIDISSLITENSIDSFVSLALTETDLHVLKGWTINILLLIDKFTFNIDSLLSLLDSEHVFIRSCIIEIIYKTLFSSIKYTDQDQNLSLIAERVNDTNYLIRAKALSLINMLFEDQLVPNNFRMIFLECAVQRMLDKTAVVRKKAILVICNSLKKHPFGNNLVNEEYTAKRIKISHDKEIEKSVKTGSKKKKMEEKDQNEPNPVEENVFNSTSSDDKIFNKDKQNFINVIKSAQIPLKALLVAKLEIEELSELVKICYSLKISDNFPALFSTNHSSVVNTVASLVGRIKLNPVDFLLQYDVSDVLKSVARQILLINVDESVSKLSSIILNTEEINLENNIEARALFLLTCVANKVCIDTVSEISSIISRKFFSSKTEAELRNNILLYRGMLDLLLSSNSTHTVPLLIRGLVKMNFLDIPIAIKTVQMCFLEGSSNKKEIGDLNNNEPVKGASTLALYEHYTTNLITSLVNKNCCIAKLLFSVGCIAAELGSLIDRMEIPIKGVTVPDTVKERRRSLNAARMSLTARMSLSYPLPCNIADKDEDEVADILFYVKEREILNSGLIAPYIKLIIEICSRNCDEDNYTGSDKSNNKKGCDESIDNNDKSNDNTISDHTIIDGTNNDITNMSEHKNDIDAINNRNNLDDKDINTDPFLICTCYTALLKCMSISSEFFESNINLFLSGLKHRDPKIRNNCIIAMRDFFFSYNFLLEKESKLLFNALYDKSEIVRKSAFLVVFDLLVRNVIRIKGQGSKIGNLLVTNFDKNSKNDIKSSVMELIRRISKNESMCATILYESCLYCEKYKMVLNGLIPLLTEKVRETVFVKLLRSKDKRDVLRYFKEVGQFSDKFNSEMTVFEEYNTL